MLKFLTIRYIVKEMLGQGTFGQVVKCWDAETSSYVAVKVIKNQPAYTQQAVVEVSILDTVKYSFAFWWHLIFNYHAYSTCRNIIMFSFIFLSARRLMLKPELKHRSKEK
jgi:dual specificity protein kinase YAK1